jgi:hypothetical protein
VPGQPSLVNLREMASKTRNRRTAGRAGRVAPPLERLAAIAWTPFGLVLAAGIVYLLSNPNRQNVFNHFVWQADAFLKGRFAIDYPVFAEPYPNWYFQDVMPVAGQPGLGLIPFPPLPAILLMPLVLVDGLATNAALLAVALGALNVGLAWRMLTRVTEDRFAVLLGTLFFSFGTVHWYAAMLGSTWFLAHVAALTFLLLAISLALDAENSVRLGEAVRQGGRRPLAWIRAHIDPLQFVAGFVFGLAALARLTVIFGAPFFLFVGGGGSYLKRGLSAGLGAGIPLLVLLLYNVSATGHIFHPAYEYLYQNEYLPRPEMVNRDWMIEDPRYIPQNLGVMLAWPPETPLATDPRCTDPTHPDYRPPAERDGPLLDTACPLLRPDPIGMSLLLSSPAYLLALGLLRGAWRRRLVIGAALAVLSIALVNLMHFSQGWVQFGYRFSNDFAPFAVVLVTLAIALIKPRWLSLGLVAASIAINAWGVYWGVVLGW